MVGFSTIILNFDIMVFISEATMKALTMTATGGPEVFSLQELPTPIPTESEVLIKLDFAALNHVDLWVRKGSPAYPVAFPHVAGVDGAGVVAAIGPQAEGVSVGDRVVIFPGIFCGTCFYCRSGRDNQCDHFEILGTKRFGTYADFVAVPDENVVPLPDQISTETAAAFPVAYLTAWHMLVGRAQLKKDDTLLIVGAGAGVSMAAMQIAAYIGAKTYAVTSSQEKVDLLRKNGADDVFILNKENAFSQWAKEKTHGRGVEVVFEHVGPATWDESVKALAKYGRLVTCGATTGPSVNVELRTIFGKDLSILGAKMGTKKEFQQLCRLVFASTFKPTISAIFPLHEGAQAHRMMEQKKQTGKILLKLP
jgi:2-desacetyl-2-hydroxyethyl bacteriochlorophyllide A dehydrogenase